MNLLMSLLLLSPQHKDQGGSGTGTSSKPSWPVPHDQEQQDDGPVVTPAASGDHAHATYPYGIAGTSPGVPGNRGKRLQRTVVNAATYTVKASDEYVVAVIASTFTLPPATSVPAGWCVLLGTAGGISVTVSPAGTDKIGDVAGNLTLATTSAQVQLISDGVDNWECIRPGT
jgi:hypothetical protein